LPPQQRVVVVLRVWDGLSYAQIAEVLGRTEATVRSHMHHGLIALRKDLDPLLA
jgi:RNA polymerase sigma-70 factor (ECF subfamily)